MSIPLDGIIYKYQLNPGGQMNGILAPSIVTYQYVVDNGFSRYVNVSFPFKVKIEEVWFTGDRYLLGGDYGNGNTFEGSYRELKLGALKAKSPKTVVSNYDIPSDWAPFFGFNDPEEATSDGAWWGDDNLKPTMWLGIPDDQTAENLKNSTTQYLGTPWYDAGFRSSSSKPPALKDSTNPYWYNDGWNSGQRAAYKYKTEMGVMNPDEILTLFLFNSNGNWDGYEGNGVATIHIAYTGVGSSIEPEATKQAWNDWWYD